MSHSPTLKKTLSEQLVEKLYEGIPKNIKKHRVNHAKGILVSGTFTPSTEAAKISKAPHFNQTTPIIVRLSNSTGFPDIADQSPKANPRGIAIRFKLANQYATDIIGHSVEGFPADTPQEFLHFLDVANQAEQNPQQLNDYLETHQASKHFFSLLGQVPQSFSTTAFYPLHAFKFTNQQHISTIGRYQIQPVLGVHHLNEAQIKEKDNNFLGQDLIERLNQAPIQYKLLLQIANATDDLMHISQPWRGEHQLIELGLITLNEILDQQTEQNQSIMFDPTQLISGIESVNDPMFAIRSPVYQRSKKSRDQ